MNTVKSKTKKSPLKICAVTGKQHLKEDMIKLAKSLDGRLCFDLEQKLPGEELFVLNARSVLVKFLLKGNIDKGLADSVELAYIKKMLSIISLAKKSGNIVLGKEKIKLFLKSKAASNDNIIIQATDASIREKWNAARLLNTKNTEMFFNIEQEESGFPSITDSEIDLKSETLGSPVKENNNCPTRVYELFDRAQLSKACGKDDVVYIIITNQFVKLFEEVYNKYNCYIKA